jgi:hypothetical protein
VNYGAAGGRDEGGGRVSNRGDCAIECFIKCVGFLSGTNRVVLLFGSSELTLFVEAMGSFDVL